MAGSKPTDIDVKIALAIRTKRAERDLLQKDLAALVNITAGRWGFYETGEVRIPAGVLLEVAEALQTPIAYFYAGAARGSYDPAGDIIPASHPHIEAYLRSEVGQALNGVLASLKASTQKALLLLLQAFASGERSLAMRRLLALPENDFTPQPLHWTRIRRKT